MLKVAPNMPKASRDAFTDGFGAVDCRELIDYDLRSPGGHEAFLASGAWRDGCMRQIEFVVERLAVLAEAAAWEQALSDLEAQSAD